MGRFAKLLVAAACSVALPLLAGCAAETDDEAAASDEAAILSKECTPLVSSWMDTKRIDADGGKLSLRVGEARPERGAPVADILYLHGFADRMDNHKPLFDEWTKRGARVISFEYPSHGETCGASLARYTFTDLVDLASYVEGKTVEDRQRPLYLAGWSTGGLIATRLVQGHRKLSRPVAGSMLFAPGIDVQVVLDKVTVESLTSHPAPPHTGPIAPKRPSLYALFSGGLLLQAHAAREEAYPNVPTIIFAGGDESDTYADSPGLRRWVSEQRQIAATQGATSAITGVACEGGKHELDNEIEPMGQQVRSMAGEFFTATSRKEAYAAPSPGPCRAF